MNIHETQILLTSQQYDQWKSIVFSSQWWSLLFLILISWFVWWKLVDKLVVFEVLSFALIIVFIGTALDEYGVKLGLWAYPIKIFYLNCGLIAGDWALPPVVNSLVYQYCPHWKNFIIMVIAVSAFLAFIGEPILIWMGVYQMYRWNYFYSFIVYISVAVISKWIVDGIKRRTL